MNNYWVSWTHYDEAGEFHFKEDYPCWEHFLETADAHLTRIYWAAVKAKCLNGARHVVESAYNEEMGFIDFRFVIKKPCGWSPFCEEFPKYYNMTWY